MGIRRYIPHLSHFSNFFSNFFPILICKGVILTEELNKQYDKLSSLILDCYNRIEECKKVLTPSLASKLNADTKNIVIILEKQQRLINTYLTKIKADEAN